ncbi:hypothetical protein N7539_007360 [Penicillium diatomitis]|uniref:Integral membrane protein n=1 Tax=Penicillium diatomitis TaxID=2819901 RepID=A0A9X0BP88_9EURO|nr:uncharacterized protein N7539_007360 [Penicillium diatomitis]KAJ5477216.1 hypothetical protein N7539_007360 [Penicillium diatomitis]
MSRNKHFSPDREPLSHHQHHRSMSDPTLQPHHVSGPFALLNPTSAYYTPNTKVDHPSLHSHEASQAKTNQEKQEDAHSPTNTPPPTQAVEHIWRSRDNRKGRHAIRIDYNAPPTDTALIAPHPTTTAKAIAQGILRMFTRAPVWDVSWLVAFTFVVGSIIWIVNAFFVWLPLVDPSTEFSGEVSSGGRDHGIHRCDGTGCFGWALEKELGKVHGDGDASRPVTRLEPRIEECTHHHINRRNLVGQGLKRTASDPHHHHHHHHHDSLDFSNGYTTTSSSGSKSFRWLPSWDELKSHYIHELGFLASLIQFLAATIFWIAGFTGLPGINNHLSQPVANGVYWVPQIVGGAGFIASGLLFTLETQEKWYKPAFHVLGWHVGAWNFVGGIGFTLCGALGPASSSHSGVEYQTTLATFWGSWAFMVGSTLQWYESLQKYPVERKRGTRGSATDSKV